jgi:hypothetical protein
MLSKMVDFTILEFGPRAKRKWFSWPNAMKTILINTTTVQHSQPAGGPAIINRLPPSLWQKSTRPC